VLAALSALSSCKQEQEAPAAYPPSWPQAPAPAPGPATPAPAPAPAPPPVAAPTPAPAAASPFERARQLCVTRTNDYRARVGRASLSRRADADPCGDAQARSDAASQTAHGAFGQCRERAQNECPAWDGTPEDVIDRCLAMMFAEGPGGPHYVNITDAKYHGVACSIVQVSSGALWVVQNFYP
jgi:hypothetical protein